MAAQTDLTQLDRRITARMIRKQMLSEKDLEKALKALPDLAEKAAPVDTIFEESAAEGLEPESR